MQCARYGCSGLATGRKGCREGACLPAGTRKDGRSWALAPSLHLQLGNPCPTRKSTKKSMSVKRACVHARACARAINARMRVVCACAVLMLYMFGMAVPQASPTCIRDPVFGFLGTRRQNLPSATWRLHASAKGRSAPSSTKSTCGPSRMPQPKTKRRALWN